MCARDFFENNFDKNRTLNPPLKKKKRIANIIRKNNNDVRNSIVETEVYTSLDFHIGRHCVLICSRTVRLGRRRRHHRLLLLLVVLAVHNSVVGGQQRRRGARGCRRDRFALFDQLDYLVGLFGQVPVRSEWIVPSVRTEKHRRFRYIHTHVLYDT